MDTKMDTKTETPNKMAVYLRFDSPTGHHKKNTDKFGVFSFFPVFMRVYEFQKWKNSSKFGRAIPNLKDQNGHEMDTKWTRMDTKWTRMVQDKKIKK